MTGFWWWLNPARWFGRVVAATGARDAGKSYPRSENVQKVPVYPTLERVLFGAPGWQGLGQNVLAGTTEIVSAASRKIPEDLVALANTRFVGPTDREQAIAPYEAELLAIGEVRIDALRMKLEKVKQKLEAATNSLQHEIDTKLVEFRAAQREHRAKEFRHLNNVIPLWLSWVILIMLCLAELPLNNSALEILRQGPQITLVTAIAISASIIILAHFVGIIVRHWVGTKPSRVRWVLVLMLLLAFGAFGLAVGMLRSDQMSWVASADLREARLRIERQSEDRSPEETSKALAELELQYANATKSAREEALYLVLLNFALFVAGLSVSYMAHDSDPELERIVRTKKRLQWQLGRLFRKRAPLAAEHDRYVKSCQAEADSARNDILAKIFEYRDYNQRYRSDALPSYFADSVSTQLFQPIFFGRELDTAPASINDRLKEFDEAKREEAEVGTHEGRTSDAVLDEARSHLLDASFAKVDFPSGKPLAAPEGTGA